MSKAAGPIGQTLKARAENKEDLMVSKKTHYALNPLALVEEDDFNLRDYDDPEVVAQIEGFYEAYRNGEFVPSLIVWTNPATGLTSPVEGHLRRRGALKLVERHPEVLTKRVGPDGKEVEPFRLEVQEFKGTLAQRTALMMRSDQGLKLKPLKRAMGCLRLHEEGMSNADIAVVERKTVQHVEQMLLLAKAGPDVHELVKSGKVDAQAAIAMIRKHKEKAGEVLAGEVKEVESKGGKTVTRGTLKEWAPAPTIVSRVIHAADAVVSKLDKSARVMLAKYETMDPEVVAAELAGKKVEIDAATLMELLKANGAVVDARAKKEQKDAQAKAAAAQAGLPVDGEEVGAAAQQEAAPVANAPAQPYSGPGADDPLFAQAKALVIANKRASTTLIQRELKVSVARAGKLIDALEDAGVVEKAVPGAADRAVNPEA